MNRSPKPAWRYVVMTLLFAGLGLAWPASASTKASPLNVATAECALCDTPLGATPATGTLAPLGVVHSPVTNTFLDFFTNGGQYMPRTHCMTDAGTPDWPWIIGLVTLTAGVIVGYLRIFFFWRRAYLDEEERDRNEKLMQLAYIFLWCAVCGYVMSIVSFVWPAYRLLAVFLAFLNFFTWKFNSNMSEFRISLSARRLQRQLSESLAQKNEELERQVANRTSELRVQNEQLEAARLEARKLALVAANAGASVVITDASGLIEWVNDSFISMTGYTMEEVKGQKPGRLLQGRESDPKTIDRIRTAVAQGQAIQAEIVNYTKTGQKYWLRIDLQPVHDEAGTLSNFIAIETDITASKQAEQQLSDARDAANAANRAKSEFLAHMSHEIRTPLGAVIGFSDLLISEKTAIEEDRLNWASTIRSSAKHLLSIINDVLDVSKIEAGKMEMESIECKPLDILSEVASVMRVPASEKGLELSLKLVSPLPSEIKTDPTRFKQVLLNLVNNSIKFTEHGSVRLLAGCDVVDGEGSLFIHVNDTGIGMTPDQQLRILKPFVQGDSSMTRRFGGTGLGLTISKFICEQLGGNLTIESKAGVGSTFTARISVGDLSGVTMLDPTAGEATIPAKPLVTPMAATTATLAKPETSANASLRGTRILVADDGQTNRKLINLILRRAGAEVVLVENGAEAVQAATGAGRFDVIFMDMQMPVLDGYSATRQLREMGMTVPIVALTAHAMRGDRDRCLAAGCDDYLTKPVEAAVLMAFLQKLVKKQAATNAGMPEPLTSELPMDDEEFRDIALSFVNSAQQKVEQMYSAIEKEDFDALARLGHWMKGSGGSAGYPMMTEVAGVMEQQAIDQSIDGVRQQIGEIRKLVERSAAAFTPADKPVVGANVGA